MSHAILINGARYTVQGRSWTGPSSNVAGALGAYTNLLNPAGSPQHPDDDYYVAESCAREFGGRVVTPPPKEGKGNEGREY